MSDDIINLQQMRLKLVKEIEDKNSLDDLETTGSLYKNRLLAEKADPHYLGRLNSRHAFIKSVGGKPMIKCLIYNEFFKKEITEYISPESFAIIYSNETNEGLTPDGKAKGMTLGKWWLGNLHRKTYETITFEPDKAPGEYRDKDSKLYWNTWEGFSVEAKKGCWKLTKKHIWKILCNKDKEKFKYVMRWLAWAVQNPGERAEVAVIFKGKKGAGKGFIFTQMIKLFGRHGASISNREHLTGKFNQHLSNLSFLFADEAYYPGDKEVEGVLKQIITEPNLTIEAKFSNVKLGRNCLHIGMATNADWVIPASEDERRYFINKVDDYYTQGNSTSEVRKEYFTKLWGEMDSDGLGAMLYDLKNLKLKNWHPRLNVPQTEELMHQIELSLPFVKRAMLNLLEEGTFPGSIDGKNYIVSNANLLEYFHKVDPKYKNIAPKTIVLLLKDLGIEPKRTGAKGRFYIFPELSEMRRHWEIFTKSKPGWRHDEQWYVEGVSY